MNEIFTSDKITVRYKAVKFNFEMYTVQYTILVHVLWSLYSLLYIH